MNSIGVSSLEWIHVDVLTLGSSLYLSRMETQRKLGRLLTELAFLVESGDR